MIFFIILLQGKFAEKGCRQTLDICEWCDVSRATNDSGLKRTRQQWCFRN